MFGLWLTGLLASREIERLTGARSIAGLVLPASCGYGPRRPGTEVHTDSLGQRTHCGQNVEAPMPGRPTLFGYGFLWAQTPRQWCVWEAGAVLLALRTWEPGGPGSGGGKEESSAQKGRGSQRGHRSWLLHCARTSQPALTSAQRDLKQEDRAPAGQLSVFFCLNHTLSPMAFPVLG